MPVIYKDGVTPAAKGHEVCRNGISQTGRVVEINETAQSGELVVMRNNGEVQLWTASETDLIRKPAPAKAANQNPPDVAKAAAKVEVPEEGQTD